MECAFIDKMTPASTHVSELAPPKSDIPTIVLIQSIAVEYAEEYVIVEPMDSRFSRIPDIVSSLGCWRR